MARTSLKGFQQMTQACIHAGRLVERDGSPEVRVLMKLLLIQIALETARRDKD